MIILIIWLFSMSILFTAIFIHGKMHGESKRSMLDQLPLPSRLEPPEDLSATIGDVLAWARQRATYTPVRDYVYEGIDAILNPRDTYEPKPQPTILTAKRPLTQDQALALNQAIRNHAGVPPAILGDQWTFEPVTPAEYSMGTSEHGMISGVLTQNEMRERMGTTERHFARYLPDIGYVTSDTKEHLDRACEVVLKERYDKLVEELRLQNHMLRAITETFGYNPAASKISERERKVRDKRLELRNSLQLVVEQLTAMNDDILHPR